jgi:hypothetical protein
MPIVINGSGTVTGISVGGIPDGVVDTDVLAANAVTFGKIGTTEQGQLCKAWVNFNGTGAVAIRASYNVSSITDNGVGDYTVNLTTAAADTNYAAFAHTSRNPVAASTGDRLALVDMTLSSAAVIRCFCTTSDTSSNSVLIDQSYVTVAIFR